MSDINWSQKRMVLKDQDAEFYVQVRANWVMEVNDYVDGGRCVLRSEVEPLTEVGIFTNAQIDAQEYLR